MKSKGIFILMTSLILIFLVSNYGEAARGGGGRGGGGRGGGGRAGGGREGSSRGASESRGSINRNNISRTPTMSRASSFSPSNATHSFSGRVNPTNTTAQRGSNLHNPQSKAQFQSFLQQHPTNTANLAAGRGNLAGNAQGTWNNTISQRNNTGNNLRQQVSQQYPNSRNWFNNNFWNNHQYRPNYWNNGYNAWGYSNWSSLNSWLPEESWDTPVYYDNGLPVDVSAEQENIYNQNLPSSQYSQNQQFYQPSVDQSGSQPQASSDNSDWMPLGVFALTSNSEGGSEPVMFFQLALNKSGSLEGTYYNQSTDEVYPIDGMVDQTSQKAIWKISVGQNSPVFETGLYNLTLPQTSLQVFFGNDVQNWLMIRMNATS